MAADIHKKNKSLHPGLFETGRLPLNGRDNTGYAVMHCDGASSGNPGRSGIGVVINLSGENAKEHEKKKEYRLSEYIGIATNNVAEYSALIRGLEKARSLGLKKIKIFLDSELLVRQMNGIYKVKNKNLMPLWIKANNILKEFDDHEIIHVRREMNKEADLLATGAVKKAALL